MVAAARSERSDRGRIGLRLPVEARGWWRLWAYSGLGLAVIFLIWPEIDLAVSGLFYDRERGVFPLGRDATVRAIRGSVETVTVTLLVSAVLAYALHLWHRRPWADRRGRAMLALLLAFALGPGLLVSVVLKETIGRGRPSQVEPFRAGGTVFTPALVPSSACPRNCSFVSADVAAAAATIVVPLAMRPGRPRRIAWGLTLGWGVFVAGLRLVMGAHFLSDVLFALLLCWALAVFAHRQVVVGGVGWRRTPPDAWQRVAHGVGQIRAVVARAVQAGRRGLGWLRRELID